MRGEMSGIMAMLEGCGAVLGKYTLILPRSHSESTANGETGEEAESRSQRTNIPPQS